jgi:hypothetical protein
VGSWGRALRELFWGIIVHLYSLMLSLQRLCFEAEVS